MSEFEDRLRDQLRHQAGAPDEAFVANISASIARAETRRRIALAVVCLAAGGLVAVMAASLVSLGSSFAPLLDTDLQMRSEDPPAWLGWLVPALAVPGLLMALAPARRMHRE